MSLGVKGDLKQEIFNEVNENVRALERLFPSAVKDGQVDFEALKEELGQFEEVGPEKYGLTWSGKQNAKKIAQQDIVGKTLKYIPEDSKNPETTENLYIEGDNLEVLKLLRQNYYGAIKMIYIDPPYNLDGDFIYNDNFKMNKYESAQEEGDISDLGERYIKNLKSSNRFHAKWLSMMYPRLKVAKDLLSDEGIIFISIDNNEISNIEKICNEIYGEENRLGIISVVNNLKGRSDDSFFATANEYLIVYCKNNQYANIGGLPLKSEDLSEYKLSDSISRYKEVLLRKTGKNSKRSDRPNMYYPIYFNKKLNRSYAGTRVNKDDIEIYPLDDKGNEGRWRWSKETFEKNKDTEIVIRKNNKGNWTIYVKMRDIVDGKERTLKPKTVWIDPKYDSGKGTLFIKEMFKDNIFTNPKPLDFLTDISRISTNSDSLILDFFSGTSSTANAVMKLNAEEGGKRKFIMVQLLEKAEENSEAYKSGYKNICEIGKERIRRAGELIKEENKDKEGIEDLDIGFKVFRVGDTNIRWNYEKEDLKTLSNEVTIRSSEEQTTFDFIAATNHQVNLDKAISPKDRLDFMPGAKDIDIVYEILLRQRDIPLSSKVELLENIGKRTYIFADSYLVCLEEDITVELIEKLAELNPLPIKFILRDSAFGDDIALKDEAYRRLKALIERNSGENKKTYTVEFI